MIYWKNRAGSRRWIGSGYSSGIWQRLSDSICYAMENEVVMPQNFHGVGGMKIFSDLIFLMRGMMRADHKFFKSHGQYDFPQNKWGISMKMYLVGWQAALLRMHEGDTLQIYIPAKYGYGSAKIDGIPAWSTLDFTLTLVKIL